jgi:triacylglycerol lipase
MLFILPEHSVCAGQISNREGVILLHGLARTKHSMNKMEQQLKAQGFDVVNWDYPSRNHSIEKLAEDAMPAAIEACRKKGATTIHFVTHSMGGILVRYYLKHHEIKGLGRVVMLSPPNGGSEVVDTFRDTFPYRFINGPAGKQLGTDASSLPRRLGKVEFDSGVITGDRSINPINSVLIPGADDGKVSVTNAKVAGMSDFLVVHVSHPFIMKNREVITQTIHFLKNGKFDRNEEDRKE